MCSSNNNDNGEVLKDIADNFSKLFALLLGMVAVKFTKVGDTLFSKPYTTWVIAAVMLYFFILILHTLLRHNITISTYFLISLLLFLGCVVSFSALRIISPDIAIFNLALWVILFIVIIANAIVNYQNQSQNLSVTASSSGELELVSQNQKFDINGDGKVSASDLGQSSTKLQEVDPGLSSPCITGFDRDKDGMSDLKEFKIKIITREMDTTNE